MEIEARTVLANGLTNCRNNFIVLGDDGWMIDVASAAKLCEGFAAALPLSVADIVASVSLAYRYKRWLL
jgi:hypothetical protein